MKVKEESEKTGLKLNIKIMASGPITSWQINGETMETMTDFIFQGLQNHYPFQYSCLENLMERRAYRATVQGVAKSRTRLSDLTHKGHYKFE